MIGLMDGLAIIIPPHKATPPGRNHLLRHAVTRPPSNCPIGRRLKRLIKKPKCANAKQSCEPVLMPRAKGT